MLPSFYVRLTRAPLTVPRQYKKASWIIGNRESRPSTSSNSMSIDALVHSNPTSPSHARAQAQASSSTPISDNNTMSRLPPLPPYQPPNPQISRKPTVDDYFSVPPALLMQGRKRRRSSAGGDEGRRLPQMFS